MFLFFAQKYKISPVLDFLFFQIKTASDGICRTFTENSQPFRRKRCHTSNFHFPKMRYKKLVKVSAVLLGLFALGAAFVVENVLPYAGIKPYRMVPAENTWRFPKGYLPENYGLHGREFSIETKDSLTLKAWFFPANGDSAKATVIVLHGIGTCKETQFGRAKILTDNGFNAIALDLRAHGESGGDYCTFGFYEKNDLVTAVDSALQIGGKPVGIWGASLGGAIALQAMGLDGRIAFGVIESTFDEFEKVAEEYGADWMLGFRSKKIVERVIAKSGQIAHFDPKAVKPVEAAAKIDRPMLFLHGDADDKIPIEFNRRNFEAVESSEKQWITVEGGGHSNIWKFGGDELEQQVLTFLARQPNR
jgi:pimeloyl-ACP methyl ester carboxylesterase